MLHCDHELAAFITEKIGDGYKKDAAELEKLLTAADNAADLEKILAIKKIKKQQLKSYLEQKEGVTIDEDSILMFRSNVCMNIRDSR